MPVSILNQVTADASASGANARLRIALFIEEDAGDWHARRLAAAFGARDVEVVTTSLSLCAFDSRTASGLDIPGFDGTLPDAAFVRSVSAGSLEQITLRLGILHALEASGRRVWNSGRVIERCVDKAMATFLFAQAGLPVPPTVAAEGHARATRFLASHTPSADLVAKPLFGSQGKGVVRVATEADLPQPDAVGAVYYLQTYIQPTSAGAFADIRVFVSAGRVLAAMTRRGQKWVTNIFQGGTAEAVELVPEMTDLALRATAAIGADYAGVDLIRGGPDNRLYVLEINSNPAWKGLEGITGIDIAAGLADDFLAAVRHHAIT